jgi:hypothetical protein
MIDHFHADTVGLTESLQFFGGHAIEYMGRDASATLECFRLPCPAE